MNEYKKLELMLKDFILMRKREEERHQIDAHLLPQTSDILDEVIGLLENELDAYEEGYQ
tara:strand:+ start:708 stop:884 length:177 start_codon:yes stop_codon:yes gene_type:complete